jgi:hypothetical protein
MSEKNNSEGFPQNLGKQIVEEYGEIFQSITLDDQTVYLEQHIGESCYPMTRIFIFNEDVVEVYGRDLKEVFEIDEEDTEILREIREVGNQIKEKLENDPRVSILRQVDIQGKINAIKYYPAGDWIEIEKLMRDLRSKKNSNYVDR